MTHAYGSILGIGCEHIFTTFCLSISLFFFFGIATHQHTFAHPFGQKTRRKFAWCKRLRWWHCEQCALWYNFPMHYVVKEGPCTWIFHNLRACTSCFPSLGKLWNWKVLHFKLFFSYLVLHFIFLLDSGLFYFIFIHSYSTFFQNFSISSPLCLL